MYVRDCLVAGLTAIGQQPIIIGSGDVEVLSF